MLNLIQQPIQSCHLQALNSAILETEVQESQRLRFQTVVSEMSVYRIACIRRLNTACLTTFVCICCQRTIMGVAIKQVATAFLNAYIKKDQLSLEWLKKMPDLGLIRWDNEK